MNRFLADSNGRVVEITEAGEAPFEVGGRPIAPWNR